MKHTLSFCTVNKLNDYIAEVIINKEVEISLEMVEEYEAILAEMFTDDFGLLVNQIHNYEFSFEAKLTIASHANQKAIAVVNYNKKNELLSDNMAKVRKIDGWNLKSFSGLELGWQQGFDWLEKELSVID